MKGHKDSKGNFHPHGHYEKALHESSKYLADKQYSENKSKKINTDKVNQLQKAKEKALSNKQNSYWQMRFRNAKNQNHGYEQIMDNLQDEIKENKKDGKDTSYLEHLYKEIVDAERVRPHKSFGYNWKTRSVEEIVDENPNITESELRRKAKDIHSDFTDSVISDGIKELKKDSVISESNGKFKHQKDYIHDKESY